MYRVGWIIILAFTSLASMASTSVMDYSNKDIRSVSASNSSGNIDIAASVDGKHALVIDKIKWNSDCRSYVDLKSGKLTVLIETKEVSWNRECKAHIILSVPRNTKIEARSGSGHIRVSGLNQRMTLKSGSGSIKAQSDSPNLFALTGSGLIEIKSGNAEKIVARSGSGQIKIHLKQALDKGSVIAKTGSGDVQIFAPQNTSILSDILSGSGHYRNDFKSPSSKGKVKVSVKSGSGDIYLRKTYVQ